MGLEPMTSGVTGRHSKPAELTHQLVPFVIQGSLALPVHLTLVTQDFWMLNKF